MRLAKIVIVCLVAVFVPQPMLHADLILGGSALVQYDAAQLFSVTGLTPIHFYDASNGAKTATQAQILAIGGGGAPVTPAASYNLTHDLIIGSVTNPTGRARQSTNADIDPLSPLSSWSSAEQIGIDGVTIFSVFPAGGLAAGDYSLVYSSALNRLSLVNNFQFPVEAFRINNPTFTTTSLGFVIEGDLLTGDFFTGSAIAADQDLGYFRLNAVTAVPEPSACAVLAVAACGFVCRRRQRNRANRLQRDFT